MPSEPLRVGVIGANPERGWASTSHLPAIQGLGDVVALAAVATTRLASARAAAERFGAAHAFADADALITHPDVEAVTIAVTVPQHRALVLRALRAGKHVYCEWPLGRDTAEAEELARAADEAGIVTAIGLQARLAPEVLHARALIHGGHVGPIVSAALRASVATLGGRHTTAARAWLGDVANGTNALTVTTGHALDTLAALVGEPSELAATTATRVAEATVAETGATIQLTSPDQIAFSGRAGDGVVIAGHVQGGARTASGFALEIRGEEGLIELTSRPSLTAANLVLRAAREDGELERVEIPERLTAPTAGVPAGPPASVAPVYRELARAIRGVGSEVGAPDFAHALRRHRTLDALRAAADSGVRQGVPAS
jgi:predicted dehydrogenase